MQNDMIVVTATAPVNIAVIKYWGKRDEELILPINGSISLTLDKDQLRAKTTIAASRLFTADRLWLNGIEQDIKDVRLQNVLKEVRRRSRKRKHAAFKADSRISETDGDNLEPGCDRQVTPALDWKVHICSENNFPTAAGLASSAAGLACLVYTLGKVFNIDGDLSDVARLGSGSACRSMYGGFVEWKVGVLDNGSDSVAKQIEPETHWPDMEVLVLVVSAVKKHTGSTEGMQTSVSTSQLLQHRAAQLMPRALQDMTTAIRDKDFHSFAELTMKDSNQMHATCLDTYPPISYLTDTSHDIIRLVHAYNQHCDMNKVAYTFDAGPNACLYLVKDQVPTILGLVQYFFPPIKDDDKFFTGLKVAAPKPPTPELIGAVPLRVKPGAIQYIIHTKVGSGPQVIADKDECLLDDAGLPMLLHLS